MGDKKRGHKDNLFTKDGEDSLLQLKGNNYEKQDEMNDIDIVTVELPDLNPEPEASDANRQAVGNDQNVAGPLMVPLINIKLFKCRDCPAIFLEERQAIEHERGIGDTWSLAKHVIAGKTSKTNNLDGLPQLQAEDPKRPLGFFDSVVSKRTADELEELEQAQYVRMKKMEVVLPFNDLSLPSYSLMQLRNRIAHQPEIQNLEKVMDKTKKDVISVIHTLQGMADGNIRALPKTATELPNIIDFTTDEHVESGQN